MGLCKCPKKKVTNQFCFEHRVNVCEHCMVANHPKCIVQSYLHWLQDSDYEPICQLCSQNLAIEDCVRLVCYHVFHWRCLNHFAEQFPTSTAPAGYTCPTCKIGIFPASNVVSPVTDALRNRLSKASWARAGLGLPLIEEPQQSDTVVADSGSHGETVKNPSLGDEKSVFVVASSENQPTSSPVSRNYNPIPVKNYYVGPSKTSSGELSFTSGTLPRKLFDTTSKDGTHQPMIDHDEDKYKRRPALEWFNHWFRSQRLFQGRHHGHLGHCYKRWVVLILLGFIMLCTVVMVFVHVGRESANTDPLLDPHMNPHIQVKDSDDAS